MLKNVSLKGHQSNIKFSYFSYAADRLSDYKKEKVKTTFYKSFSFSFLSAKKMRKLFRKVMFTFLRVTEDFGHEHRLNMELYVQSLFGLLCTYSCTH
jgi:hypothetical protein